MNEPITPQTDDALDLAALGLTDTGESAKPARRSRTVRNYHENDQLANSRSNYRRTSSRYTSKRNSAKHWIIALSITLGVLLVLGGAAIGIARYIGLFKFGPGGGTEDTTLISLHGKGKESLLPAVNVDTLLNAVTDIDGSENGLIVFRAMDNKDDISGEAELALIGAIEKIERLVHPPAATPSKTEGSPKDDTKKDAAEGEGESAEGSEAPAPAPAPAPTTDSSLDNLSFVMISLDNGLGVAYNPDGMVYGAGSVKALYATFFASQLLDTVRATADIEGQKVVTALSDNGTGAYESLRAVYDEYGWDGWVNGIGAKTSTSAFGSYPNSSGRMMAKAWLNVYRYLTGGTANAVWLGQQLEASNSDLLVRALALPHTIEVTEIRALDEDKKEYVAREAQTILLPGLNTEMLVWAYGALGTTPDKHYGIAQQGILLVADRSYVFSVMCSLPDSAANRQLVEDLLAAGAAALVEIPEPELPEEPEAGEGDDTEGEGAGADESAAA